MSVFTGPLTEIYADTTIPGTSAVAMTAFRAKGNSVKLRIKTTTGGCVSLTFTAEESEDGTTYYSVIDRDSVWSFVTTVPTTAGTYVFDLEGLDCTPNMYYRLSYQAATAAGKLQVYMLNWENPKGGGISVSVPDVVVDVNNIDVNIEGVEQAHSDAVGAMGFMQVVEAKDFDGSALPNDVSEGDAVRPAASLYGVTYSAIVSESGAETPLVAHSAAIAAATGGSSGFMAMAEAKTFDGSALPNDVSEGDAVRPAGTKYGVGYVMPVSESGTDTPLIAHDTAIATGLGTAVLVAGGEAESVGSVTAVNAEGDASRLKTSLYGILHTDITDPTGAYAMPTGDATARPVFTKLTDATTDSDILPLTAAVKPTGALGVAGEIVDFDTTAGEDFTAAIGILGKSATGSAAIPAGDAVGNPIYVATGDGTTTVVVETSGTKKAFNVNVTDGTNDMPTMDANTRPGFVKITDGTDEADVIVQHGAFGTASKGLPLFGKYENTPTTYDDGDVAPVLLDANGRVVLSSDIEIGAVELKNGATDDRALISDANTARAATDHVLSTQPIDAAGNVLGRTAANTARTTGTLVDPVQIVDAAGNVVNVTAANTARTTGTLTLPTQPIDEAGNVLGRTAANTARTTGTLVAPCQPIDAAGQVLGRDAANTARTVATLVNPVQIVDSTGAVMPAGSTVGTASFVKLTDGTDTTDVVQLASGLNVHNLYAVPVAAVVSGRGSVSAVSEVAASAFAGDADNFDGNTGLNTISLLCGRVDDNTVKNIHVTAGYAMKADTSSVGGTAYALGAAAMAASQPVTLATDDTHMGAVGMASDVDGALHGQLRYIGDYVDNIPAQGTALMAASTPITIATDDTMFTALDTAVDLIAGASYADDADWTDSTSKHILTGGLYQSVPQSITDGDVGPFQVDSKGNIKSVITDGTNVAAVGTGTTKTLSVGIHDGEKLAGVTTCTAMADDLDGLNGLITASVLHGYVDDNTTHTVLVNSSGHVAQYDPNKPAVTKATGSGAIATSIAITVPTKLLSVECKLSAAPTSDTQPITVTKNNVSGSDYDVVWYSQDLVALASTSFSVRFNPPIDFYTGDSIDIAWINTDARTYGLTVTTQVV